MVSNISRPNNFQVLDATEWKLLCTEVKKDYGDKLTINDLSEIVLNGIKGKYDRTQFVINGFTIYKWIDKFLETQPKKTFFCPKHYPNGSFYWEQLSQREQIDWIEKNAKND